VEARDTLGAGDAFLAEFLAGLPYYRLAPQTALLHACRLAEFVAEQDSATPPYLYDTRGHLKPLNP